MAFLTRGGKMPPRKSYKAAFVSSIGRHTPISLGKDTKIHEFCKEVKERTSSHTALFEGASSFLGNIEKVARGVKIGQDIHTLLTDNGHNPLINSDSSLVPMLGQNSQRSLGKNGAQYYKIHTHIGKKTSSKINKLASSAHIIKRSKCLSDSLSDYLTEEKRRQLNLQCGFNEKGYAFLLEDTYLSVNDYYKLFELKKRFKKELQKNIDGVTDIYGCVTKTHNRIKLRNRMDFYSMNIKIHLIKIMSNEKSVRDLVEEIVPNKVGTGRDKCGRIPSDFMYDDPDIEDPLNTICTDFTTHLSCDLNQSSRFKEHAKVIKTWSRSLQAGSILEFNLTTHLGKGIHLNRIYNEFEDYEVDARKSIQTMATEKISIFDFNKTNITDIDELAEKARKVVSQIKMLERKTNKKKNEHPTGYVLALEYVGDRRACIARNKDHALFEGYSPCNLSLEFQTNLTYLTEEEKSEELLVYRKVKGERNFDEDNEKTLKELFCPDRLERLHIDYPSIDIMGNNKTAKYSLIYDQAISSSGDVPALLDNMKDIMKNLGLNPDNISAEDMDYNFTRGPASNDDDDIEIEEDNS